MSTEPPTPNAANDDLAALLGSARRGLTPTADDRARSAAALSAQLAAAAIPKAIGAKGLSAALKGLAGGKLAGIASLAGLATVGAVSVSVAVSVARAPTTQPTQPTQPTETAQQTMATRAPVVAKTASNSEPEPAPATAPEPLASSAPTPKVSLPSAVAPTTPPTAATPVSIAEETRLVRGAETALRQGNSAEALALLAEHARRFPQGVLAEEREGERAIATCTSASPEARAAAAARFRRAHPDSAMLPRVAAACR